MGLEDQASVQRRASRAESEAEEARAEGKEKKKEKKANPEIWSLAWAEILPSAFSSSALGNEKQKKLMKEKKKASRPLKLYTMALLRKALENRGVT